MSDAENAGSVTHAVPASYRDPAGFVFRDGAIYKRAVTKYGEADYRRFSESGLYEELVRRGFLIGHREEAAPKAESNVTRCLVPEQIPFVSYPYEWSFDQLRDAALLTLEIQERALAHGITLKDASAYNVQFRGAKAVFIDTLSFQLHDGGPWAAYEQFCRHFLGPLLLMSYRLPDAARYLKADVDGFPLENVSKLLPCGSYLRAGALLHIHLHARARRGRPEAAASRAGAPVQVPGLVASLRKAVERVRGPRYENHWTEYYAERRFYPEGAQESKREAVGAALWRVRPELVYDLGANTGAFSRDAVESGSLCIAFDSDAGCVNRLYLEERGRGGRRILPLVMDLANPSPSLGFELQGTMSIFERPQADLVLCLALLHHLRVTANLPFERIAGFLARMGQWLLLEYVPVDDPAVTTLTARVGDFEDYSLPAFLGTFTRWFRLHSSTPVRGTKRTVYLFERLA